MNDRAPAPEHVERLRARARALAVVPPLETGLEQTSAVAFLLGGQRYALEARFIQEAAPLRNLTAVPYSLRPLFGLTHWRGGVLAVLDLRHPLGLNLHALTDLARLIVLDAGRFSFGIAVDTLAGMEEIDEAGVAEIPGVDPKSREGLVKGVTGDGTLVLDPGAVLRWATSGFKPTGGGSRELDG